DADAKQPRVPKHRGHSMREGAVTQRTISAKSKHSSRELLIGKFHHLRVVIRIDDDDASRGPGDAHHLMQCTMRLEQMLKCTIGAASIEGVIAKRQPRCFAGDRDDAAARATFAYHGKGAVNRNGAA